MSMDNSIATLIRRVDALIDGIKTFRGCLEHHVIIEPKNRLDEAVRCGFPEDICHYYYQGYMIQNIEFVEELLRYIDCTFIPYLENVRFHLSEAVNYGSGGAPANTDTETTVATNASPKSSSGPQGGSEKEKEAVAKNQKNLESVLGIKKGPPMSISEADKQNANPHYGEGEEFGINCATCVTAYALRLRGFDVKAKGNPGEAHQDSLNYQISNAIKYNDVWQNIDGSKVEPIHTDDWMNKNGIVAMTTNDYRRYFDETCKETGVYVVMVRWIGDEGGHATILQRDKNGILYYIEPQVFDSSKGVDGKRSLEDLLMFSDGSQKLFSNPSHGYGVLRVDNKIFNTKYANLFETN